MCDAGLKGVLMKPIRFLIFLLIPALAVLLSSCWGSWQPDDTPKPTSTYELQPTETAQPTPLGNYCDDATTAGARTRYTFQEIIPCLDTIEKVSQFMSNNMMYDGAYDTRERGGNEYAPAWLVYERGVDDCDGHAILQCYFLESNGWDAVILGLNIDGPTGHNVCAVTTQDSVTVLDNLGSIVGSFATIEDAALHYINASDTLRSIRASQITQITTDSTTPSVLGLPWNVIWSAP